TVPEALSLHRDFASAQDLGVLPSMVVPNTMPSAAFNFNKTFQVGAADVVGRIDPDLTNIDPATTRARSENDYYKFTAKAGEVYTMEVMSNSLSRVANPIDSVLRL